MSMADRVVCMNQGTIEQVGSPDELYLRPRTSFVANFVGQINVVSQEGRPELAGRKLTVKGDLPPGPVEVMVRPEHVELAPGSETLTDSLAENSFPGVVVDCLFLGNVTRTRVQVGGVMLLVEQSGQVDWAEQQKVRVRLPPQALIAVSAQGVS